MRRTALPNLTGGDLTTRQRKIIQVIEDSARRDGYPPTLREIAEAAGLASTSSVAGEIETILELKVGPVPLWGILLLLAIVGGVGAAVARRPPSRTRCRHKAPLRPKHRPRWPPPLPARPPRTTS